KDVSFMFQSQTSNLGILGSSQRAGVAANIIQLQDACVSFDKIQALRNIELTIAKGEIVFVTGASGAGKTTLLRLLAGEIKATSGKVLLPFAKKEDLF